MPEHLHVRDHRIDVLRGLALIMIFVNHIPGTIWENLTSRNFGFSDAAEAFVLMSGIATGLAYGPPFLKGNPTAAQVFRPWRRALTIWSVHILVVASIVLMFRLAVQFPEVMEMAERRNIAPALLGGSSFLAPLALLGHQFAYADILPLYIVLLLATPLILFMAVRAPVWLMLASVVLWAFAGISMVKFPTWPLENGWFFNPLAWQILFVAGVLTGLALRQGKRLLPIKSWAVWLSAAFLGVAALWIQIPIVAEYGGHGLWLIHTHLGVPSVFTAFDKSFLFLPRLLHILALAYLISALASFKTQSSLPQLAPLALLGRHSLPVFATSTVLAYAAQIIKAVNPPSIMLDTLLIGSGLAVLFVVAVLQDQKKQGRVSPQLSAQKS